MNGNEEMNSQRLDAGSGVTSLRDAGAHEVARRALFSAASRVLSYHAAALDAKVARIGSSQPEGYAQPANARQLNG